MHVPLGTIGSAIEEPFEKVDYSEYACCLQYGPAIRNRVKTLVEGLSENVDGHVAWQVGEAERLRERDLPWVAKPKRSSYPRGVIACDCASPPLLHQQTFTLYSGFFGTSVALLNTGKA